MFGRVPGTRPNISEYHSEISTRVPFCISAGGWTGGATARRAHAIRHVVFLLEGRHLRETGTGTHRPTRSLMPVPVQAQVHVRPSPAPAPAQLAWLEGA